MKNKKKNRNNINRKKVARSNRLSNKQRVIRNKIRRQVFAPHLNYKSFIQTVIIESKITTVITPCNDFRLIENTNEVIKSISELKNSTKNDGKRKVVIDLLNIEKIDIGAISLMLSSVKELSYSKIKVSGSVPENEDVLNFLSKSGFFSNVARVSNQVSNILKSKNMDNKNILLLADCKTKRRGTLIGNNIKQIVRWLKGIEGHFPPLYTVLMEMNANAFEHAYNDEKKHWVLGVNYDEHSQKVYMTFTDNGFGIINQLNIKKDKRIKELVLDLLKIQKSDLFNNGILLQKVFDKVYNSRFKSQLNRNRGLPIIKESVVKNVLNNLICITNDVYLNFSDDQYVILDSSFDGTFYYWELELNNLS